MAPVIVHGGGPMIKDMLSRLDVSTTFINGLRQTDKAAMDVVEMVLTGSVNPSLVRKLSQAGLNAVGLSGSDNQLIQAKPIDQQTYGYVGQVTDINAAFIKKLLQDDLLPVIAPIGVNDNNDIYNVNADTAANAVANALQAERLVFVTNVPGIMKNEQLLQTVTVSDVQQLIDDGVIHGGMLPKVTAAVACLDEQLDEVMIVHGNQWLQQVDGRWLGTTIIKDEKVMM